jgi:1-acyl-sn-glycerol-3-phosphate acyltransferase
VFYRLCRSLFRFFFAVFCRWEIEGLENVPEKGPVIIVANHVSNWDPIVIGCAVERQVHFMAKKELFEIPFLGFLISVLGSFPVDRGCVDRAAIRQTLKLLNQGEIVGIFPEGTRSKTGELLPPSPGAAYIALKAQVPICPVALLGTNKIFCSGLFPKFKIRVGSLLDFSDKEKKDIQEVADLMMEKIQELLNS